MTKVNWWKVRNQSLAIAVRNVGFDLTVYDDYTSDTQAEIQKLANAESLKLLRDNFQATSGKNFKEIKRGVYVICLSHPFAIQYDAGLSEIIYIGQGNVSIRLKDHYEKSLFRFMQSLSGANFDFYISEPKKRGGGVANSYHKHIEYVLLKRFSKFIGGGEGKFPLLNNRAGANKKLGEGKGWDMPLKRTGKKPHWALEPTKFWDFEKLD